MSAPRDPWPAAAGNPLAEWRTGWARALADCRDVLLGRPLATVVVWLTIGLALAVPVALLLAGQVLADAASTWRDRPGATVFLQPAVGAGEGELLAAEIAGWEHVDAVEFVDAGTALAEIAPFLDASADLAIDNPLPHSVRILLAAGATSAVAQALGERLRATPGVADVLVEGQWVERAADLASLVRRLGWLLLGALAAGGALATFNAVRIVLDDRLDEIDLLMLIGATGAWIRRPYLLLGIGYGVGGGLMAAVLIALALRWLAAPLQEVGAAASVAATFSAPLVLALMLAGAVLGWLGALGGVLIRLRARAPSLR